MLRRMEEGCEVWCALSRKRKKRGRVGSCFSLASSQSHLLCSSGSLVPIPLPISLCLTHHGRRMLKLLVRHICARRDRSQVGQACHTMPALLASEHPPNPGLLLSGGGSLFEGGGGGREGEMNARWGRPIWFGLMKGRAGLGKARMAGRGASQRMGSSQRVSSSSLSRPPTLALPAAQKGRPTARPPAPPPSSTPASD